MSLFIVASFVGVPVGTSVTDFVCARTSWSRTAVTRITITIGLAAITIALVLMPQLPCDLPALIALNFVINFCDAIVYGASTSIPAEMSKNFVSSVYSVQNAFGMLPGTFIPWAIGVVLASGGGSTSGGGDTIARWATVFYLTAAASVVSCGLFYFVKCEREPWDDIDQVKYDQDGADGAGNGGGNLECYFNDDKCFIVRL